MLEIDTKKNWNKLHKGDQLYKNNWANNEHGAINFVRVGIRGFFGIPLKYGFIPTDYMEDDKTGAAVILRYKNYSSNAVVMYPFMFNDHGAIKYKFLEAGRAAMKNLAEKVEISPQAIDDIEISAIRMNLRKLDGHLPDHAGIYLNLPPRRVIFKPPNKEYNLAKELKNQDAYYFFTEKYTWKKINGKCFYKVL